MSERRGAGPRARAAPGGGDVSAGGDRAAGASPAREGTGTVWAGIWRGELRLECLPAVDVAAYVAGRPGGPVAAPLAAFMYARTDGNALFMVHLLEHLVQQGRVVRREGQWTLEDATAVGSLPEGLRHLLLRRIEALARARGGCWRPRVSWGRRLRWPRWRPGPMPGRGRRGGV